MAPLGLGAGFYRLGPTLGSDGAMICRPDSIMGGPPRGGYRREMLHWYKFNTGILTNATGVTRWRDVKGTNFLAPTATNDADEQPALTSDGTLRFQQNTDSLRFDTALSLGKFSVYFVHKFRLSETISSEVMFEGSADSLKFASANEARWKCTNRQDFKMESGTAEALDHGQRYVFGVERAANGDVAMYKDNILSLIHI